MESYFVSVIIPVYNGEAFLEEAIQSIQQQNYQSLEIIIVDDGSTDRTAAIAASYSKQIRYIFQPNCGPAAARNKGLEVAHGNVIAFLDVDDLWTPNKLKLQLSYLSRDPSEVVLGRVQVETLDNEPEFKANTDSMLAFVVGCGLFRKSVFERIGYFDVSLRYGEDIDWFLRAREQNIVITVLPQVTLLHRKHRNNMTRKQNIHDLNIITVLRKSLDRRRRSEQNSVVSLPSLIYINEFHTQANLLTEEKLSYEQS